MNISIRAETTADIQSIHEVTTSAFLTAAHTGHTEQYIVDALRKSGALSISLVAEQEGKVIGQVSVSPVSISDHSEGWYGLGPISVLPSMQGKGVGSRLMKEALLELNAIGSRGCVLLGDPNYYHRFGFKTYEGLVLPDVPKEYFQALLIQGEIPQGRVAYHESFSATE